MRALLILPLLMLGACQVTEDKANDQVTMALNADVAENGAADAIDAVQNSANTIATRANRVGEKIDQKVDNTDVNLTVRDTSNDANTAASNDTTKTK